MASWQNPCAVDGCRNIVGPKGARGWCTKHYQRWLKTGDPQGTTAPTPEARFWAKVQRTATCWLWTASTDEDGYGLFRHAGRMHRAHRWLYEQTVGKVPDGLVLDHRCRVHQCVNPGHLEPVTNDENLERGWGRRIKTGLWNSCVNGHEFTAFTTYINPLGRKVCRTCMVASRARYEQRKAA